MRRCRFYLLADSVSWTLLQEMMEYVDLTHLILSLRDCSGRRYRFYPLADLVGRNGEKWGETLAIFKIPRDGEKFSWGGMGVVKSHEETKSREISRQYMPMLLLLVILSQNPTRDSIFFSSLDKEFCQI